MSNQQENAGNEKLSEKVEKEIMQEILQEAVSLYGPEATRIAASLHNFTIIAYKIQELGLKEETDAVYSSLKQILDTFTEEQEVAILECLDFIEEQMPMRATAYKKAALKAEQLIKRSSYH